MYTLMKSEKIKLGNSTTGPLIYAHYEHKEVGQYIDLAEIIAACGKANQKPEAWHYVMNDSGKEYYANNWID